jgi:hypothetical protein
MNAAVPVKISYNIAEVMAATGVNRCAVYAALTAGSLASFKLGRRRMVSARALQDWIDGLEKASSQKQVRA